MVKSIKELTGGLTRKEKAFADELLEGKNGTEAAKQTYNVADENSAAVVASKNLRKVKIIQYLEKQGYGAATRIVKLSKKARNETVRLNANKDILDRAKIGVRENSTIVPIQVNINNDKDEFK